MSHRPISLGNEQLAAVQAAAKHLRQEFSSAT
jgi:hypothetical protein